MYGLNKLSMDLKNENLPPCMNLPLEPYRVGRTMPEASSREQATINH